MESYEDLTHREFNILIDPNENEQQQQQLVKKIKILEKRLENFIKDAEKLGVYICSDCSLVFKSKPRLVIKCWTCQKIKCYECCKTDCCGCGDHICIKCYDEKENFPECYNCKKITCDSCISYCNICNALLCYDRCCFYNEKCKKCIESN